MYGRHGAESTGSTGSKYSNNEQSMLNPHLSGNEIEASGESYCIMCEKPHALTDCSNFTALSAGERTTFCRNKGLCFKCTQPGHTARACKSQIRCIVCAGNHHEALHDSSAPSPSLYGNEAAFVPNVTTFAVKPANPTAPAAPRESA